LRIEEEPSKAAGQRRGALTRAGGRLEPGGSDIHPWAVRRTAEAACRLGYEAAGVVDAVGPDVDKSWVGKTVATIPSYSMNDYAMLGEEVIAPATALGILW
jgi:NADPH:quinone reductase-like Zn-dependent oxidoreductase